MAFPPQPELGGGVDRAGAGQVGLSEQRPSYRVRPYITIAKPSWPSPNALCRTPMSSKELGRGL